jgi:pyruvate dehydrogenase E2 component (dihydrolipoyllysine-residue acetyltransferase)
MIEVTVPQLSISMEEGKVLRWLVEDGDTVEAGQPIVEIETDKATVEVEAPAEGRVHILASEGAMLAVEATIAQILSGGEDVAPPEPAPAAHKAAAPAQPSATAAASSIDVRRHTASPAARRIADQRGVDLTQVRGSGPGGRIMVRDLEAAPGPAAPQVAAANGLREAVIANITASWQQIPHIHIGGELDASGLAEAKRAATALPQGERVTVTDLLVVAVARALRDVPELNGTLGKPAARVHLALAVATPSGILAPVIRDADSLSLAEVAGERARVVAGARDGSPDSHDLAGGTFTLTNLGAYPVDFFAPVVSGPQIAMLATGRLVERPVAVSGMLAVRHRIWANVAIDHRGADGEAGGRFLAALEQRLNELPASMSEKESA